MSDLLKEMQEYFKNTPQEQVEADWKKCEQWVEVGITVDELLKTWEVESKSLVMANKEKANAIILDIYREMYAELGLDFDSCTEKKEDGWFDHFYMSNERQDEIINKHLKRKSKFVKDYVSINIWLGCSPCGRDFYYKLTKKGDYSFIKESERVKWIDGDFKPFILPSLGRSLLMSPFDDNFTWFTTPIVEIIENEDWNRIEFKTKNSHYYLDRILK